MKTAIIAPTKFLGRYCSTKYHLALVHVVNADEEYRDFYRRAAINKEWVILDNSMIELGKPMDKVELEQAIEAIRPSEFILPDYIDDPITTLSEAVRYAPYLRAQYPKMGLMVVPHYYASHNLDTWKQNHDEMVSIAEVTSIGIGKFLKKSRYEVCQWLEHHRAEDVEYHLLGTWGNPIEVRALAKEFPWLRGVDSKAPVRFGLYGVALHPELGLISNSIRNSLEPLGFTLSLDAFPIITQHNVDMFVNWAKSREPTNVFNIRS